MPMVAATCAQSELSMNNPGYTSSVTLKCEEGMEVKASVQQGGW